jgi:lysozyme family protein
MEFDDLIAKVIEREGGYVNHTADRGGPTNYGITQRVYADWLASKGHQYRSVKNMDRDEAVHIYHSIYWKNANCEALPPGVRDIHFDAAVNHGVRRAALLLQAAAGATQDGHIGPKTIRAAFDINQDLLRMRYIAARYRFYGDIVNRDRTQIAFIVGWLKRMKEFS